MLSASTPPPPRLKGIVIESRNALDVLRTYDKEHALHYVDPPYPASTRNSGKKHLGKGYRFEMSDEDHRELAATLHALVGKVALSGYPCALYDKELYKDWYRTERPSRADSAQPRVEVLWSNYRPSPHGQSELAL